MCRIAGLFDFKGSLRNELENIVIRMRDSMVHGGPDDSGLFINQTRSLCLGHRRLSIIDISALGHQPMSNNAKNIWITYNGEIYNFNQLRQELISLGYDFKSKTDTEVIIYGYEKWGIEGLLRKLRGMFAFVIYDERNEFPKLIFARDRFGIKPLYYYKDSEKVLFASEVRAILNSTIVPNEKNEEAFIRFLQLGSVPSPLTTIKNIYSLPAGHYIELSEKGFFIKQYWDLLNSFNNNLPIRSYTVQNDRRKIVENISLILKESIKLHLISDVPLGVFLSGGIDSSCLVSLASRTLQKPVTTLSVTFEEEEYNEAKYARLVAQKYETDHREVLIKKNDFINELPQIFNAMDQPTIDGVNTYFISKAAKEAGLTVVLSGAGGDEVFLGYRHYRTAGLLKNYLNILKFLPGLLRKKILNLSVIAGISLGKPGIEKIEYLNEPTAKNAYNLFRGLFTKKQIKKLTGTSLELAGYKNGNDVFDRNDLFECSSSLINSFDYFDFNHYLQNQILKDTDFMSMYNSIEIRVPFLDHFLVEQVLNLSPDLKLGGNINKSLLVDSIGEKLPNEVVYRKKKGFTFPISSWLKSESEYFRHSCLSNTFLEPKIVNSLWESFMEEKIHWSRIWALVVYNQFSNIEKAEKVIV